MHEDMHASPITPVCMVETFQAVIMVPVRAATVITATFKITVTWYIMICKI